MEKQNAESKANTANMEYLNLHGERSTVLTPPLDILGAARDLNRPGSATRAKLSFSFEKIEA